MELSYTVSFPEGVSVSRTREGGCLLHTPHAQRHLPPPIQYVSSRLVYPGESARELAGCVRSAGCENDVAYFFQQLRDLAAQGLLHLSINGSDQRIATLVPTASSFLLSHDQIDDQPYVLSRFAYIRRLNNTIVLESPLSPARLILHDPRATAVIGALAEPVTTTQMGERIPDLPATTSRQLMDLIRQAGMLDEVESSDLFEENIRPELLGWEFHDLLFHSRSRYGRYDGPVGNTYPLAGLREAPPVVKPPYPGTPIKLYQPDLNALENGDPPLAWVMERRRSIREFADAPMTARQLGEFLYRTARVREIVPLEVDTPHGRVKVNTSSRPYPTGGALFALEVYPVIWACEGLVPGVYHYAPEHHHLVQVTGITSSVEQLLDHAGYAVGARTENLQVLLVLTARFERVMWKYAGLAYSLILKDVGVLFQNMYLVATAMDLAPCAIGTGNSDLFAHVIGSDYYCESSVGEFTLGSKR